MTKHSSKNGHATGLRTCKRPYAPRDTTLGAGHATLMARPGTTEARDQRRGRERAKSTTRRPSGSCTREGSTANRESIVGARFTIFSAVSSLWSSWSRLALCAVCTAGAAYLLHMHLYYACRHSGHRNLLAPSPIRAFVLAHRAHCAPSTSTSAQPFSGLPSPSI